MEGNELNGGQWRGVDAGGEVDAEPQDDDEAEGCEEKAEENPNSPPGLLPA